MHPSVNVFPKTRPKPQDAPPHTAPELREMALGLSVALAVAAAVHVDAAAFGQREGLLRLLHPQERGREQDYALNRNVRGSRQSREACRHWQHVGCLGDVLEKTCDTDGEPIENALASFLTPRCRESVWSCCCPSPYAPCARDEADTECVRTMVRHFAPIAARLRADAVTSVATPVGETVQLLRPLATAVRAALLAVRAALIASDPTCAACLGHGARNTTAAQSLLSTSLGFCGSDPPSVPRSIRDNVLFCETVTWQWENLGDGSLKLFARQPARAA